MPVERTPRWRSRASDFLKEWSSVGLAFLLSVGFGLVLTGLGISLIAQGVDGLRAHYGGAAGVVHVDNCEDTRNGWRCEGEFVPDDGSLVIDTIEINPVFEDRPAGSVEARVSGPSARHARAGEDSFTARMQTAAGAVMAGMGGWILLAFVRPLWRSRRDKFSAPNDPPTGDDDPPPLPEVPTASSAVSPVRAFPAGGSPGGLAAALSPPAGPVQEAAPTDGQRRRGGRPWGLWRVLAGYLALLVGTIAFAILGDPVPHERLTETASARVVGTNLGPDADVEVRWTDRHGQEWLTRLTPRDPDQVAIRDEVLLRYDPQRPDDMPYPADLDTFRAPDQARSAWYSLLIVPGLLLAMFWTWRLGRWATGALRSGEPVTVEVVVAHYEPPKRGYPGHAGLWLKVHMPDGRVWYQRAMWSRALVSLALDGPRADGRARPCLGLRRMYLVEVPGVGTILPTSTARSRVPRYYQVRQLAGYVQADVKLGTRGVLAIALVAFMFFAAGPWAVPYLVVIGFAGWHWMGATPFRGVRGGGGG